MYPTHCWILALAAMLVTTLIAGPDARADPTAGAQPTPAAPPPAVPVPKPKPGTAELAQGTRATELAAFRARLPAQLAAAKVADDQRTAVLALADKLAVLLDRAPTTEADGVRVIREYLARGGELRDLLYDLGLPDPGDLLPPGPRSRLGITFNNGGVQVVVQRVLPQYRADKMGMRAGDVILTLNGASVTPKGFVQAVVKAEHPYRLEIRRGGRRMTLEETTY